MTRASHKQALRVFTGGNEYVPQKAQKRTLIMRLAYLFSSSSNEEQFDLRISMFPW